MKKNEMTTGAPTSYPGDGHRLCCQLEDTSFWFCHRNNCILETMGRFPPGGTVYDIGGGNGFVTRALLAGNIGAVLVEPGQSGVENARKRGIPHIIPSTLEAAGFRRDSLPAAGLFDVLEHIPDEQAFLGRLHRLLQPGGRFYLTVPAFRFLWSADDAYAGHFKRYTVKRMKQLLIESGFRVIYATYIFSLLPLPIFLFRTLPYRLGLKSELESGLNQNADWERDYQKQHSKIKGMPGQWLEKTWNMELKWIKRQKKIPFGGSCLVVADKT